MIIPPTLQKNDTIGFVSPSAGLAGIYKYRVERAIKWFTSNNFKIKIGKNFWKKGYIAGEPEERADDINEMINDKKVKAIICAIGGENSIQILKYIDFRKFRKNPKIFIGFSDITVLHLAFYKMSKVTTYYGPMILTQFGEFPEPFEYTIKYFFKAVSDQNVGEILPEKYTDQFLDWGKYKNIKRKLFKDNKFKWLKEGKTKGKLVGGCLPSILRLAGTKYLPSFDNSIIFLELPEGHKPGTPYPIDKVDADLSQLIEIGIFDKARGLIFGIPYKYTKKMKNELFNLLLRRLKYYDFPILCNVNFGHIDPIITIPYGATGKLDSEENLFKIII